MQVVRFELKKIEKLRFPKVIPDFCFGWFQDFFFECHDSNSACFNLISQEWMKENVAFLLAIHRKKYVTALKGAPSFSNLGLFGNYN